MDTMTEQTLLRLAMVLQDKAPSTLDKYICKLATSILFDYPEGLNKTALSQKLNEQFNLDFTEREIENAIQRKGASTIKIEADLYYITDRTARLMQNSVSFSDSLERTINRYLQASGREENGKAVHELLMKYLYYCFNSNVDNLLSLFNKKEISPESAVFEATNDEIITINGFLAWPDNDKDTLIYNIVAMCYEYCMLTMKKDNILSKELFKGKRFYIDANIIFRMAGINNEERQFVTRSFEKHCKEVGIELICTSSTLDELYRVIEAEVDYIKGIAGNDSPVSYELLERINPTLEINDFYKRYYEWCQVPGNIYGDYMSFKQYLFDLIHRTLTNLTIKDSSIYKVGSKAREYSDQVNNLIEFKNEKRKWRDTTKASAETDVTNILDILKMRKGNGKSLWETNDFMVSADHRLIDWSNNIYPGVPIVVLPSVWLSIILRYTGRSDDDYKSFCLFLTQRQHRYSEDAIDSAALLRSINTKTNQKQLKEQIIVEIAKNKSSYSFKTADDYDSSTDRAFDIVLKEYYGKTEAQIKELRDEMAKESQKRIKEITEENTSQHSEIAYAEQAKTVFLLAKNKASRKTRVYRILHNYNWIFYVLGGVILVIGILTWIYEWKPVYTVVSSQLPEKIKTSTEALGLAWTVLSAGVGLVFVGIGKIIEYLGSREREQRLSEKYYSQDLEKIKSSQSSV